jgi:type II secretory pathway component HofQ
LTRSTNIFQPSYSLAAAANIGLMLFNNAGTKLLALELQAAENDSRNKTISSPRIVTLNRKAATINNTQQVTILTGVNATTGLPIYQTISAPLTLGVTPSVNPDNRISLDLNIAKSTITNATTGSLDTNTVTTNVIVENGGTVVIGGFAREVRRAKSGSCSLPRRPALCGLPLQDHDQEPVAQRTSGIHHAAHCQRLADAALRTRVSGSERGRLLPAP